MTSNLEDNEQNDSQGQFEEGEDYGLPQLDFSPLDPLEFNEITSKAVSSKYLKDEDNQTAPEVKESGASPVEKIDEKTVYSHQAGGNKKLKFVFVVVLGILIASIIGISLLIVGENADSTVKEEVNKDAKKDIIFEPVIDSEIATDTLESKVTADTSESKVRRSVPADEPERETIENPNGQISEETQPLKKYFLVVASFLDKDLAYDYADQLILSRSKVFIIPPTNISKFTRVAVGKYETLEEIIVGIDNYNDEFDEQIWALKY